MLFGDALWWDSETRLVDDALTRLDFLRPETLRLPPRHFPLSNLPTNPSLETLDPRPVYSYREMSDILIFE